MWFLQLYFTQCLKNEVDNIYKEFFINEIPVKALGNLDDELGDELRAFKRKKITDIPKIVECFTNYYKKSNTDYDIMLYIPSNKNTNAMSYFSERISSSINLCLGHNIKFAKDIKEQKYLEYLNKKYWYYL